MTKKIKPISEDVRLEAEHDRQTMMPDDGEAEAMEKFLETEAPGNDERRRYSPEYSSTPNALDELSIDPDGQDTYPEEEGYIRARGENPQGSSQRESVVKTLGNPGPPSFPEAP